MPRYTTGEMAKLCGVSVRTVQYYDSRNLLSPSELSEGGRRLYSEDDLSKLKIICFLRELDLSINSICGLFAEEHPENAVSILLEEQEKILKQELAERQDRLNKLSELQKAAKRSLHFSVASIGDIAYAMENKKKMRQLHIILLTTGIPLNILQWAGIILWIACGMWQLFAAWALIALFYGIWVTYFYFNRVVYICPQCHKVFRPAMKEAIWARHTPTLRKLTCTYCGCKSFCVETYGEEKKHE